MVFTSCHLFTFLYVYYSYPSSLLSNYQSTSPLYTRNVSFNQFLCIISFRRPDINSIVEYYTYHVVFAPIEQSCIEIILKSRRIKYFVRCFRKLPINSGLLNLSLSQTIIEIQVYSSDYLRFIWRLKIAFQWRRQYRLIVFMFLSLLTNSLNRNIVLIAIIWVNIKV